MSGSSRFRRGVFASLLSQVIGSVEQLLLVPLYLAFWGEETFGQWLCLFAAVSYLTIADLGLSTYVVNRLNQQNARAERDAYLTTLHSSLAFSLTVSVVVAATMILGALALPFESWLRVEGLENAVGVACLLALQVTVSIPRGLVLGIYRTVGEYGRGAMLTNARRVVSIVLTAGLLVAGVGPLGIALGQLVPITLVFAVARFDLGRRHPWISLGTARREHGLARRFLKPSLYFLGVQLSLVLVLQGTTVAAGALFGASVVVVFVMTRTLTNLVRQFISSLSNALWPEITALGAREERATLIGIHRTFVKGVTAFALAAATFLHLAGVPLFELWSHGRVAANRALMDDFLLLILVQTPWTASSYVLLATNRHVELARRQLAAAVLSLVVGVTIANYAGPRGLVWGCLLAETALCATFVPREAVRVIGDSLRSFVLDVYGRGLLVVLVVAVPATFLRTAEPPSGGIEAWSTIAFHGVVVPTLVAGATWLLWLSSTERARIAQLVGIGMRPRRERVRPHRSEP